MGAMPAKAEVNFLLENLSQLIIQEGERLGRFRVEIRDIEEDLEFMASMLQRSEAHNQIYDEHTVNKIKRFIEKAETLIEEYATNATTAADRIHKDIIYSFKRRSIGRKVRRFGVEVKEFISNLPGVSREDHDQPRIGDDQIEVPRYLRRLHGVSREVLRNLRRLPGVSRKGLRYLRRLTGASREDHAQAGIGDDQREVPRYLWRFIYYFLLFPAELEIPARRLIVLWVAEDLIRSENGNHDDTSVEDTAERYLNELIDLGVVRVTKKKLNGKVQACLLSDAIRDEWLVAAENANFFQSRGKVRRLVDLTHTHSASSFIRIHRNPIVSNSVADYGDVISFMSFGTQEGSKPGEDIGNFLHKCIKAERFLWLRMLDLERVFRPKLPVTLGKLIRLKYLGLRWTYLQHLPHFVNKLLQLQVLDVKHTYITLLPSSIWRMKDLRHLYLSEEYRTRFPDRPSGNVSLTHLQTLWGAFIGEDTCVKDGLDTLEHIRKLGLSCRPRSSSHDMSKQLQAVDKWISKLLRLKTLRLKSRDAEGEAADLHLSTLGGHKFLSTVYLLGRLNPRVVQEFPPMLTEITLSGSQLKEDPMPLLKSLPKLHILRLLAKSVLHPKLRCSTGDFPVLEVVHIWSLENLEEWEVEEGSLPCLKSFEIRSCPNLKNLPPQLQQIHTLDKFRLTSMSDIFMKETELTQPRLWAKIQLPNLQQLMNTDDQGLAYAI